MMRRYEMEHRWSMGSLTGVEPGGVQGDHRNVPGHGQGLGLRTET